MLCSRALIFPGHRRAGTAYIACSCPLSPVLPRSISHLPSAVNTNWRPAAGMFLPCGQSFPRHERQGVQGAQPRVRTAPRYRQWQRFRRRKRDTFCGRSPASRRRPAALFDSVPGDHARIRGMTEGYLWGALSGTITVSVVSVGSGTILISRS